MDTPKRYHPILVTLHWLVAILVFANLYLGLFTLGPRRGDSTVAIHMAAGITILALILARFVVRIRSKRPADATAGNKFLDILAKVVHYALYFFLLAITIIGLVFALRTNRLQSAFFGAQPQFSAPLGEFPPAAGAPSASFPGGNAGPGFQGGRPPGGGFSLLTLHLFTAYVLLFLISLHIVAALYHQLIRKDHLIARMWYGKR